MEKQSTAAKIERFYNEGAGQSAARVLHDGAVMELLIDDAPYTFEKKDGKTVIASGKPKKTNYSVRFTREAFADIFNAKNSYELRKITVKWKHRGGVKFTPLRDDIGRDYYWTGYHYWSRRMGIIFW